MMDEKTEALIGPEPVIDPAAAEALERKVREEDDELRVGIAYYALIVGAVFVTAFLFLLEPIFAWLGRPGQSILWILVNIPLVAFLGRAWRQSRFPLGRGHAVEGDRARMLALGLLLLSLATFFAAGLAEELWGWVTGEWW
jgi:hypothetical protein